MPIPVVTKIDPRDLNKNIAIGIALPFSSDSVFRKTYTTQEQVKYNIINLILTNKGERIFNPNFGSSVRLFLFEGLTNENIELVQASIEDSVNTYIPEVQVKNVNIINDSDENTITITIYYQMILSGNTDAVTINFAK